jgi:hypothetical protein
VYAGFDAAERNGLEALGLRGGFCSICWLFKKKGAGCDGSNCE